jgi:hypothetical protein
VKKSSTSQSELTEFLVHCFWLKNEKIHRFRHKNYASKIKKRPDFDKIPISIKYHI